jgi:hypothetical protein
LQWVVLTTLSLEASGQVPPGLAFLLSTPTSSQETTEASGGIPTEVWTEAVNDTVNETASQRLEEMKDLIFLVPLGVTTAAPTTVGEDFGFATEGSGSQARTKEGEDDLYPTTTSRGPPETEETTPLTVREASSPRPMEKQVSSTETSPVAKWMGEYKDCMNELNELKHVKVRKVFLNKSCVPKNMNWLFPSFQENIKLLFV